MHLTNISTAHIGIKHITYLCQLLMLLFDVLELRCSSVIFRVVLNTKICCSKHSESSWISRMLRMVISWLARLFVSKPMKMIKTIELRRGKLQGAKVQGSSWLVLSGSMKQARPIKMTETLHWRSGSPEVKNAFTIVTIRRYFQFSRQTFFLFVFFRNIVMISHPGVIA